MSLIEHSMFPRSNFDVDSRLWHNYGDAGSHIYSRPSTLDFFDAFDELDHYFSKNIHWLNKPEFVSQFMMPAVLQKYRIVCDVMGFSPKSIKTEIKGNHLYVHGKEEMKMEGGDFSTKEFKRTYEFPQQAITEKMVSFVTGNGKLVIEMPLKETPTHSDSDLMPKITDNGKMVSMNFAVPAGIPMEKVHVTIKDRDLIVKAEDKCDKKDSTTRYFYYKRTKLPENTDFGALKCAWNNHKLSINAPINTNHSTLYKKVPIELRK
jgi:HSP20 family molecular chaperone IbpA